MTKRELAKMLGVSEATIYRWKKNGVLKQKVDELQKQKELKKQFTEQEVNQKILEKLERLEIFETDILSKLNTLIQDLMEDKSLKNYQNLPKVSHGTIENSQILSNVSQSLSQVDYYTALQLANVLGLTRRSLNDWILEGKMKSIKIKGKNLIPKEEAFKFIFKKVYDDVNLKTKAGDSVSIKNFKEELKQVIQLSEEEVNRELLDLDDEEILHLQTVDNPGGLTEEERKVAIEFNGRMLFYITWMKR